ncbi:M23 family metallopeptidase [Candidatus Latescibacterota bacterium]
MGWKKLTFVLIPHSKDNVKQFGIHRKGVYAAAAFLIIAIGVMIFYILGFKGKLFYMNQTREIEKKNLILQKNLTYFNSTLAEMSIQITHLESLNKQIMSESGIWDKDLKISSDIKIAISKDGLKLPPGQVLYIIDRMNSESFAFEHNFDTLYRYCMNNQEFVIHVPSIRPAAGALTKGFGISNDIYSKTEKKYQGVDIHNVEGTPVVATADGIIEEELEKSFSDELGRYILIDHQNGYKTRYTHLQSISQMKEKIRLKKGDNVVRGQQIGAMGRTGITIQVVSAHLMYSVYHHGMPVDPMDYFFANDFKDTPQEQEESYAVQTLEPLL